MKGFITKRMWTKAMLLLCGGALPLGAGCYEYKDLVDPCYTQRYNNMAENNVDAWVNAQKTKGHVLQQTVWAYDFDAGTDKLNPLGIEHLTTLARRLPQPDGMLFLQTAILGADVIYDPANPDKVVTARQELDFKRGAAIQKFMTAQTAGRGSFSFNVAVLDPTEIGLSSLPVNTAMNQMSISGYKGILGGGGASASGGAGAPASGGGK